MPKAFFFTVIAALILVHLIFAQTAHAKSSSFLISVSKAVLADIIVIIHLGWIIFMLAGFVATIWGFFRTSFLDKWLFRTVHLAGIIYVSVLAIVGKQTRAVCPLTIWEIALRAEHDPATAYSREFIIHYAEKLIYPDINPLIITLGTLFIAVFSIAAFIFKPPAKIRELVKLGFARNKQ